MVRKSTKQRVKKQIITNPRQELLGLDPLRGMNRLFNYVPQVAKGIIGNFPRVDMLDEGKKIRIKVDLPGIEKKDIRIKVARDLVSLNAKAEKQKEEKGKNYYYKERSAIGYYRDIYLPIDVNPKSSNAKFDRGTLEIVLEKHDNRHDSEIEIS